jgi:sRNA-binding regulator protein Hfq
MIPFDEEPPEIQKEYLAALKKNGVDAEINIVND